MKSKHLKILAVVFAAVAACAGIVYAWTVWSSTITGTVTSLPTLTLTANSTTLMVGDYVQLTAHLQNGVVSGKTVTFYEDSSSVGTAVTDSSGFAVLNRQMNTAGTYEWKASCAG